MKKILHQSLLYFLSVFVLCIPEETFSQKGHFPFLAGDKYGIADENMNIISPAIYKDVITVKDGALSLVRVDSSWEVIGKHGEKLITKKLYGEFAQDYTGPTGISMDQAYSKMNEVAEGKFSKVSLFTIVDPVHRIQYYVNPNSPLPKYLSFIYNSEKPDVVGFGAIPDPVNTGVIRVIMPDSKINFIDTTGKLLFDESVSEGDVYGSNVIAIQGEHNEIKIYDRNQDLLSGYSYNNVSSSQNGMYIHCQRKISTDAGIKYSNDLFDTHGTPILKEKLQRAYGTRTMIFDNDSTGAYLYSPEGLLIKTFPACTLLYNYVNPEMPFILKDKKSGLINSKGLYVVEPNYESLSPRSENLTFFTRGSKSGIMDESFREKWQLDSVKIISEFQNKPGYYLISDFNSRPSLIGLADSLGKIILPISFSTLSFIMSWDIIVGTTDSISAIYSLNGEYILPLGKINYEFDTGELRIWEADSVKVYDRSFKMVHSWDRVQEELKAFNEKGAYGMKNAAGQIVTKPIYEEIRRMQEIVTDKWGYLARRIEVKQDSADLLNQYGQNILPKGYVFYFPNAQDGTGNKMPFIVTNQEDIKENLSTPRTGLIDLSGRWVIKPDSQKIHIIGNKIIVTTNAKTLERHFHDLSGNIISRKPYQYLNSNCNDGLYNDRIRLGYALTDSLQSQALSLQLMPYGLRNGAIISGRFKEPVYLIGA
ncbi:MAG: WG repeat-containing protein, partial [Saprospiraceae bacterium]